MQKFYIKLNSVILFLLTICNTNVFAFIEEFADVDLSIRGYIGTTGYSNKKTESNNNIALAHAKSSINDSLAWGVGFRFHYDFEHFIVVNDSKYNFGNITFDVNDLTATKKAYRFSSKNSVRYTEFKCKALIGQTISMGPGAVLRPAIGINRWQNTYKKPQLNIKSVKTTDVVDIESKIMSIPVGFGLDATIASEYAFNLNAHYHFILTGYSETIRAVSEDRDQIIDILDEKKSFKHSKTGLLTNYALQLDIFLGKRYNDKNYKIKSAGMGFYWDFLSLDKSEPINHLNTDYIYGPIEDTQWGFYLSIGV